MSGDCPAGSLSHGYAHFVVGEMRWSTDGKCVMLNRCIRCGAEEVAVTTPLTMGNWECF